jgi:hypothetical protein
MFDRTYSFNKDSLAECKTRYLWVLDKHCDYSNFDFSWEPAPWESTFRHAFASQWQKDSGTYLIPKSGYTETKYSQVQTVTRLPNLDNWEGHEYDFDYSWHPDPTEPAYVYQFGTQWQKTGGPRYLVDGATAVKYVDSPRITKTIVDEHWTKPAGEFEDFDYTWHPDSTEQPYIYQFGTQHQKTGGPRYTVPGATDTKFVGDITSRVRAVASGAVLVKHLTTEYAVDGVDIVATTRFISNYLDTLKRIFRKVTDEYVWVISDLCDYTDFDFSWHPAVWQNSMLHVFPSNEQKFGDTFFVHVESFLETANKIKILEYYSPLNFVETKVPRIDPPQIEFQSDSVVDAIWKHEFTEPVVQFYRYQIEKPVTISLWQERLRTVVPLKKGSESVLVPKDVKNYIKQQVYDYEWIDKKHKPADATPLDIVYISNGESNAERNWVWLNSVHQGNNRIVRVDGVKGRAEAYQAALEASNTDWAFCVFAKLEANKDFDWTWQPDRLQEAKHYIFHAHNPVNGLEYGHMGMIAYNKKLVAINSKEGLDFTLDQAHEVVPLLSGTARYADDPWIAWRSAFRECLKLKDSLPNIDSKYRLSQWLRADTTSAVAGWSAIGAQDAVDYYDAVEGDFTKLRLSYEWDWLAEYLFKQHNLTPDQLCTQLQDQSAQDI